MGCQKWFYSWWLLFSSWNNCWKYRPGVQQRLNVEDWYLIYFPSGFLLICRASFDLFHIPLYLWNRFISSTPVVMYVDIPRQCIINLIMYQSIYDHSNDVYCLKINRIIYHIMYSSFYTDPCIFQWAPLSKFGTRFSPPFSELS